MHGIRAIGRVIVNMAAQGTEDDIIGPVQCGLLLVGDVDFPRPRQTGHNEAHDRDDYHHYD